MIELYRTSDSCFVIMSLLLKEDEKDENYLIKSLDRDTRYIPETGRNKVIPQQ